MARPRYPADLKKELREATKIIFSTISRNSGKTGPELEKLFSLQPKVHCDGSKWNKYKNGIIPASNDTLVKVVLASFNEGWISKDAMISFVESYYNYFWDKKNAPNLKKINNYLLKIVDLLSTGINYDFAASLCMAYNMGDYLAEHFLDKVRLQLRENGWAEEEIDKKIMEIKHAAHVKKEEKL